MCTTDVITHKFHSFFSFRSTKNSLLHKNLHTNTIATYAVNETKPEHEDEKSEEKKNVLGTHSPSSLIYRIAFLILCR